MNSLYTASMFKVGEEVAFKYRDKLRRGIVEKVGDTYFILTQMQDEKPTQYKSFAYRNIQGGMTFYGNVTMH